MLIEVFVWYSLLNWVLKQPVFNWRKVFLFVAVFHPLKIEQRLSYTSSTEYGRERYAPSWCIAREHAVVIKTRHLRKCVTLLLVRFINMIYMRGCEENTK